MSQSVILQDFGHNVCKLNAVFSLVVYLTLGITYNMTLLTIPL